MKSYYNSYYDKYIKYKEKYITLKLSELEIYKLEIMIKNKITLTEYNMSKFINFAKNYENKKILLECAQKYKHDDMINLLTHM
jgi:hypothetical protein